MIIGMNDHLLSDAMVKLAMTQTELAAALNVSQAALSQWATGARRMPSPAQEALRDAISAGDKPSTIIGLDARSREISAPSQRWEPAFRPRGRFRLPLSLEWSGMPESRWRDARNPDDFVEVAALVLDEGSAASIRRWVDPIALSQFWPIIPVARSRRAPWERHLASLGYKVTTGFAV